MGLSIHYQIHLEPGDAVNARQLVRTLHRRARELARAGKIEKVHSISSAHDDLDRFASLFITRPDPDDPHTIRGISVPPVEGCIFPVGIGEGCELLWLGLCRYPATVRHDGRDVVTKFDHGWRMQGACKTQYASRQSWEHFQRCHTTVIALLRHCADLGARVRISDEGGWWPRRSDATLRRKLDEMNGIVAAFAGAMKDADDEGGPTIASPIFAHPHFERIEAEGVARHGAKIAAAKKIATDAARGGAAGPASS